jgi:hypothetical protein
MRRAETEARITQQLAIGDTNMKTIVTAIIATLVVASGTVIASAGRELQDAVRTGAVIHTHGILGADQDHGNSGR